MSRYSRLSPVLLFVAAACGGAASSTQRPTTPSAPTASSAEANSRPPGSGEAPPPLTQAMIDADRAEPALLVGQSQKWVTIPSFRLALRFPDGWYQPSAEDFEQLLSAGSPHYDTSVLHRMLQAGAMQADPRKTTLPVIPSVRIALARVGELNGRLDAAAFCADVAQGMKGQGTLDPVVVSAELERRMGMQGVVCRLKSQERMASGLNDIETQANILYFDGKLLIISTNGAPSQNVRAIHDGVMQSLARVELL